MINIQCRGSGFTVQGSDEGGMFFEISPFRREHYRFVKEKSNRDLSNLKPVI